MKLNKIIVSLFAAFLIVSGASIFALENNPEDSDEYREIFEASGADELFSYLDEETKSFLHEIKADEISAESLLNISAGDVFAGIVNELKHRAKKPLTLFASGVGIILLTALLNSVKSEGEETADRTFSMIAAVSMAAFTVKPVSELIISVSDMLKNTSGFVTAFVPVYSGLLAASGKPVTSALYPASLIAVTEIMSVISGTVLVPMMNTYLAFCLIGSLSLKMNISLLGEKLKSAATFSLGFILTVFTGIFTIKGVVSSAADTVSMRGMKFLSSTFLPVVGGAVSDAMNAVGGCLSLIKSSVGGFFVLSVFISFLPYAISLILYIAAFELLIFIADITNAKSLVNLMKSTVSVLSVLLSVTAVFLIAIIVSAAVMLTMIK